MTSRQVTFTHEDVASFAEASHDRNPLHLSEAYARKSPFGRPVVFGALATLGALSHSSSRPGSVPAKIDIEFPNPVFTDTGYEVDIQTDGDAERLRLVDGRRALVIARITYRPGVHTSLNSLDAAGDPACGGAPRGIGVFKRTRGHRELGAES